MISTVLGSAMLSIFFLVGSVAASPTPAAAAAAGISHLAKYDDITALPGASELTKIGTYDGLTYTAFDVLVQGVAGVIQTGVLPKSGTQVAAVGTTDDLTSAPAIIVAPGIANFNLQSAFFGCVADTAETLVGVPVDCSVSFTGFKASAIRKPVKTVVQSFNPQGQLAAKMQKVTFGPEFEGLHRVDIEIVSSTSTTLTGLLMDNVAYTTFAKQ